MAVDMSYRLGWIDDSIVKRVRSILEEAKLPISPPETMTVEMFKSVMAVRENKASHFIITLSYSFFSSLFFRDWQVDKKVADGLLRLILLKGPLGNCVFTGEYDRKALDDTLRAFSKSWSNIGDSSVFRKCIKFCDIKFLASFCLVFVLFLFLSPPLPYLLL